MIFGQSRPRPALLCLSALFLLLLMIGIVLPVGASVQTPPRMDQLIDGNWRFIRQDVPGAEQPGFDDASWQAINLPHTWNAQDGADGGNNYYRGIGWYRKHLSVSQTDLDKSLFLKFDGAATIADVYVNGHEAGEHRGNFAAFCYEVTPLLHTGDNVIAVKVDNSHNPDIAPLSGDFTVFGGLYRDAHLLTLNKLSITPTDFASPGVFITQSNVSAASANLKISAKLRNGDANNQAAVVRIVIRDARGKAVADASSTQAIPAGGEADISLPIDVNTPHLWQGVDDPYLYQVTVDVSSGGKLVDRIVQPLGLRYFRVDPNEGLFLNGKHYALHGVNRHQDRIGKGWAIGTAEHEEDFRLIREMGSTGIRLSHYQHAQQFYDLCDRGGLVVWAELPLVNSLGSSPEFAANARRQLTELILQNYNHSSILFWSLFNELHFSGGPNKPEQWALIGELNSLAHSLDATRLTTAASNIEVGHPVNFITDVMALNRYNGWYVGSAADWPSMLDDIHAKYPNRCFAISEYGAGASVTQHADNPPLPKPGGLWHPEEYQSTLHEAAYGAMQQRPWLWGTFLWCMFDFASDGRHEGSAAGINDKGMVTYDRKVKKDTFFYYKANWTKEPFVYITDRRYNPRPAIAATIKVYSNCDSVDLTLNGRSLGAKTSPSHVFVWPGAALNRGTNSVSAIGRAGSKTVRDSCVWEGTAMPSVPSANP